MAKKLNLASYVNKAANSTLSHTEWNTVMQAIEDAVNLESSSGINDVLVNNTSVVTNGVAKVVIPVTDVKKNGVSIVSNGVVNLSDDTMVDDFYVNGVKKTPVNGVVALSSGASYTLKGTLNGRVSIGASTETSLTADTYVLLDGVTIVNNSTENSGIEYLYDSQTMVVTLAKNSVNKITCSNVAEIASGQRGGLFSEKNMVLQGNGYLSILNKGGHGIKASELRISGRPHVCVDASHDGIHGNNILLIHGGYFYIKNANDAFGTRAEEGTVGTDGYKAPGYIKVFGGDFSVYDIKQKVFDSKATGYVYSNIGIKTNVAAANIFDGLTKVDPKVYFGGAVQNTTNGGYTTEASGTVKCYSDADMTTGEASITAVEGVYTLTTKYAKVSGYIEGTITAPLQSTDIELNNAYIVGNISYTPTGKKLKVSASSDTVNYIIANTGNAITSGSNASIEVKKNGYLEIVARAGSGLEGDEITLNDSKGVLVVKDCLNYGIKGKDIYVGTAASPDATKKLEGAIILTNNKKADLYAILNSKFNKGTIRALKTGVIGTLVADKISSEGTCDLNSSDNVFYKEVAGSVVGTTGETEENVKIISL